MSAILEVESVTAGYVEGIDILKDVSLEITAGMITGMIGPNGAGKSTLLKTVFGFLHPRAGKIVFEGQEIQSLFPYQVKQAGISYVPQGAGTFPQMSVEETLLLGAWIFRRERELLKKQLQSTYERFPALHEKRRVRATFLSGGQLRMLSIAKEVMTSPKLLLVDEPSAGLAPKLVTEVYSFLQQIKDEGVTILLVDQNITKAVEISDYMYLLEMGTIKRRGPTEEFAVHIREIIQDSLMAR